MKKLLWMIVPLLSGSLYAMQAERTVFTVLPRLPVVSDEIKHCVDNLMENFQSSQFLVMLNQTLQGLSQEGQDEFYDYLITDYGTQSYNHYEQVLTLMRTHLCNNEHPDQQYLQEYAAKHLTLYHRLHVRLHNLSQLLASPSAQSDPRIRMLQSIGQYVVDLHSPLLVNYLLTYANAKAGQLLETLPLEILSSMLPNLFTDAFLRQGISDFNSFPRGLQRNFFGLFLGLCIHRIVLHEPVFINLLDALVTVADKYGLFVIIVNDLKRSLQALVINSTINQTTMARCIQLVDIKFGLAARKDSLTI